MTLRVSEHTLFGIGLNFSQGVFSGRCHSLWGVSLLSHHPGATRLNRAGRSRTSRTIPLSVGLFCVYCYPFRWFFAFFRYGQNHVSISDSTFTYWLLSRLNYLPIVSFLIGSAIRNTQENPPVYSLHAKLSAARTHTPEIASAFQPPELQFIATRCNSVSIKDVC